MGEGWISRTSVSSRGRHSTEPGVVRIRTTPQLKRAMFGSGGTGRVDKPNGHLDRGGGIPPDPGRTKQHDAAIEKGDVRFGRHEAQVADPRLPEQPYPESRSTARYIDTASAIGRSADPQSMSTENQRVAGIAVLSCGRRASGGVGRSCPPCRPPRLLSSGAAPWTKRGQLRPGLFPWRTRDGTSPSPTVLATWLGLSDGRVRSPAGAATAATTVD